MEYSFRVFIEIDGLRIPIEFVEVETRGVLHEILEVERKQLEVLREIRHELKPHRAKSAKGELMPAIIKVGGAGAKFTFTEFAGPSGTGAVVPASGPINYASDNTAVGVVDASGNVTDGGTAGTCNISGTDSVLGLTASDVLTVEVEVAQSATGVLTAN